MNIKHDTMTQACRSSWRRSLSPRQPAPLLHFDSPAKGPPLSFAVLLSRLSRGRLGPGTARDLLLIDSDHISLNIRIDRDTGLVADWSLRTEVASTPIASTSAVRKAPAA